MMLEDIQDARLGGQCSILKLIAYARAREEDGVYIIPDLWPNDGASLQLRYAERGWPISGFQHGNRCERASYDCPHKIRYSEDKSCLAFRFSSRTGQRRREVSYIPRAVWIWGEGYWDEDISLEVEEIPHGDKIVWSLYDHVYC